MSQSCSHLRAQYNRLLEATEELKDALNKADTSGNFNRSHELRTEIIALKASLEPYRTTILETTIQVPMLDKNGNPKKNLLGRPKTTEQTIRIDFKKELKEQKEWYASHGLQAHADALPTRIRISKEKKEEVLRKMREGNVNALQIMPEMRIQKEQEANLPNLAASTSADTQQIQALYPNSPWFYEENGEDARTSVLDARPEKGCFLVFYSNKEVLQETKNKTQDEIAQEYGTFLNLFEYWVIQRKEAERRGDHGFDTWNSRAEASQAIWLQSKTGNGNPVLACWDPVASRVKVSWLDSHDRRSVIGARPAVIAQNALVS